VYGSPFCGGAAVALSTIGKRTGQRVTLFYAKRNELHPRQRMAILNGATVYQVPFGYMSNVQSKARLYANKTGSRFIPLGFDVPAARKAFSAAILEVLAEESPDEIWCATGSGLLARCIATARPDVTVQAVAVGLASRWAGEPMPKNVRVRQASLAFEKPCKATAPFPCCPNYDRKAWEICRRESRGNALFWNVLG